MVDSHVQSWQNRDQIVEWDSAVWMFSWSQDDKCNCKADIYQIIMIHETVMEDHIFSNKTIIIIIYGDYMLNDLWKEFSSAYAAHRGNRKKGGWRKSGNGN